MEEEEKSEEDYPVRQPLKIAQIDIDLTKFIIHKTKKISKKPVQEEESVPLERSKLHFDINSFNSLILKKKPLN